MSDEPLTLLARLARRPVPILLGVVVGFLACCVAGRVAARQQPFKNFVRFHPHIAPDSHHYPTFSQTLNLARQHAKPGKVLVIVGGNSVMHGVGQRAEHLWSKHLEQLLGDRFVVLNLAMRAGHPHEFGATIAERLTAEGVPVVYVTSYADVFTETSDWDGTTYKYFFWDAWGKGLIPPDARRDEWLRGGFAERYAGAPAVHERRHSGAIDGLAYARDLWNYVANRYRATVWVPLKYPRFWRPHREYPDQEAGDTVTFRQRNPESGTADELKRLRASTTRWPGPGLLANEAETEAEIARQYRGYVAAPMHARTLFVFRLEAAYHRDRLAPAERDAYCEVFRRYTAAVSRAGFAAQLVGENYVEGDYADRSHFSERGGRKLAEDLAPTVRAMSARLYGTK
jgi:hypothetical protein